MRTTQLAHSDDRRKFSTPLTIVQSSLRAQAVDGKPVDKYATRLVGGEMTSLSASWPFGELARRRVDLLPRHSSGHQSFCQSSAS